MAAGIPEKAVLGKIRRELFPWHARVLADLRIFFGGDPFTPESILIKNVGDCSSGGEIDDAFFTYDNHPERRNRLGAKILGFTPRYARVVKFCRQVKHLRDLPRLDAPSGMDIAVNDASCLTRGRAAFDFEADPGAGKQSRLTK